MAESRAVYPSNSSSSPSDKAGDNAINQRRKQPYGTRNIKLNTTDNPNRSTHEIFNDSYATKGIQASTKNKTEPETIRNVSISQEGSINQAPRTRLSRVKRTLTQKLRTSRKTSKSAKIRARSATTFIRSTGLGIWLTFQLPLSILSILAFGLAGVVDEIKGEIDSSIPSTSLDKYYAQARDYMVDGVLDFFDTGLSVSAFDSINLFMLTYMLLFVFGIVTIAGVYLIYKTAGLNPLNGRGNGAKIGTLVLSLIGYSIPILNMLPWFYFWTIVVNKYPK